MKVNVTSHFKEIPTSHIQSEYFWIRRTPAHYNTLQLRSLLPTSYHHRSHLNLLAGTNNKHYFFLAHHLISSLLFYSAQTSFPATTALHQTSVPIITNAVCQRSFQITIDGSHLCTGGTGGKGTCDGDSGGPLTVLHNNKRILVSFCLFQSYCPCSFLSLKG